ncbi:uncharacterized protein LY89DRAFT_664845 [Mollisia scopiformis]|uniref:Zn(2)-C6 fungal-type domain-containing protein n=1 Tax=Mollisia scopiformis TaxID=149040 RepID=A0A194XNB9_MOLSC|nr:uncharacterized protein LY89DRAFT_664845 [Mollisia scopiformis]KUJ21668.1 hypothetical protein LY89DRAFT_664845 [Mollisia scopiformis]
MSQEIAFTTHDPACDRCRAKKIRCDRVRPKCKTCKRDETQCKFSNKEPKSIQASTVAQEDIERRLGSVEDHLVEVVRTIKESENRTYLRMLQLENRLLNGILTTGGETSTATSNYSSPTMSTNTNPPVYGTGVGQMFPYETSLVCNDSQWTMIPPDLGHDFASKRIGPYQHEPVGSSGSTSGHIAGVSLADWSRRIVDSAEISGPNSSALFSEFDLSVPGELIGPDTSTFSSAGGPSGANCCCSKSHKV